MPVVERRGSATDENDAGHRDALLLEQRDKPPLAGDLDILFQVRLAAAFTIRVYYPSQVFCIECCPGTGACPDAENRKMDSKLDSKSQILL